MKPFTFDLIIIGAGIVGLSTAYQFSLKYPLKRIMLIEKESDIAMHQTGHNSGVIHSGIYYKPGSLKARNCIEGYNSLIQFAEEFDIPFEICGKVIVACSKSEVFSLKGIYERGIANGLVGIKNLNENELKELEPYCGGLSAIHVPQTGIIDYTKVAHRLRIEMSEKMNVDFHFNEKVIEIQKIGDKIRLMTNNNEYFTERLITCCGLFSDRITSLTQKENDLRIIPFRGEYYKLKKEKESLVKNLIYPVPNTNFPFLGVHFTRMMNGGVEAGPNAVLAFKREGYNFSDINLFDLAQTLGWPGFWKVVRKYGKTGIGEIYRSLSKKAFTNALQRLIPELHENDLVTGGSGVRAQACDKNGILIDDFNIVHSGNIIHVRNAPSPAATSCFAIGKSICDKINY